MVDGEEGARLGEGAEKVRESASWSASQKELRRSDEMGWGGSKSDVAVGALFGCCWCWC